MHSACSAPAHAWVTCATSSLQLSDWRARAGSRAPHDTRGSRRGGHASPGPGPPRRRPRVPVRRTRRAARSTPRSSTCGSVGPEQGLELSLRALMNPPAGNPDAASSRRELRPCVVKRLIEGAAGGVEPLGEHVDRHLVQRERHEHVALVRREVLPDGALELAQKIGVLGGRAGRTAARRRRPASSRARAPPRGPATPAAAAAHPPRAVRTCRPRW